MPTATTADKFEIPGTIAGLWGLCALTPLRSRAAYEEAVALCGRLAVRRLSAIQREYHRELLAFVESYEDAHGEGAKARASLRRLAGV